jgi:2-acylglycerol O-acyltransferase 2
VKEPIPPKSILIWHPHGLMSVTSAIHNAFGLTSESYTPTKIVSLDLYHRIPILKDVMRNLNVVSSNYDSIKETLQKESVSIMLGGVKEILNTESHQMICVIENRTGIFRMALETGSPLVPVITYGENELFSPVRNDILDSINATLYSMFRIALPIPTWNSLKNWVNLYKEPLQPITTYVGKPILVSKVENPTKKNIEDLRETYIQALKSLFSETNMQQYNLQII